MNEKPPEKPVSDERSDGTPITRRDLLKTAGAAGAAAFLPGDVAGRDSETATPVAPGPATHVAGAAAPSGPLMNLTAHETEILGAMVDRLIPLDEMGPGAIEAGAMRYIDRALSEAEADSVDAYRSGLAALDRYSRYSRGAPFVDLSDEDKDSVLIDVQIGAATGAEVGFVGSSGAFFNMVKSHTWQGTFGDPMYGGNVDFIGWDILGYPGVRMRVNEDEQRMMEEDRLPPVRRSAYDYGQFQVIRGEED